MVLAGHGPAVPVIPAAAVSPFVRGLWCRGPSRTGPATAIMLRSVEQVTVIRVSHQSKSSCWRTVIGASHTSLLSESIRSFSATRSRLNGEPERDDVKAREMRFAQNQMLVSIISRDELRKLDL